MRIYWNIIVFLSKQFKINSAKVVVRLGSWFPLVDWGPLAHETFWTGRRSIVHYRFLYILVYCVTVCGIAAFPTITFFSDLTV